MLNNCYINCLPCAQHDLLPYAGVIVSHNSGRGVMHSAGRSIWIDTDIIFNRFAQDVDDGLALMAALACDRVRIEGISLNRGVDNGYAVTQRLLGHYARYAVPVYKGSDDIFASFGVCTEAVERLAQALEKQRMTIIAIGALTNLANLLLFYPQQAQRIDELVICAGRQRGRGFFAPGGRQVALPDANFDNDPASFAHVLDSGLPVTLVGFEAAASITLNGEDLRRIRSNGRPGDRWVARRLQWWRWVWRLGLGVDYFIPFDACTIGHVLHPECFAYHRQIPLAINCRLNDAPRWKKGRDKDYLEVAADFESSRRVDYVYAIEPVYKTHLMNYLLGATPCGDS